MKTASFFKVWSPRIGGRICIARYAPKTFPEGFVMFPCLAPGTWFNKLGHDEYIKRYKEEVLKYLDPQKVWDGLHEAAQGSEPILLCYEKPPFTLANFCHRRIVAEWFKETLGKDVPEL